MSEKKMIDPADVQELLNKYKVEKRLVSHGMLTGLIQDLRDLLPKPDFPEDMLGMWAEHPKHGRVLVCDLKPDGDGEVEIKFRDDDEFTGVSQKWVDPSTLSFPEQRPETLTTLEDYENAPEGTIVEYENNNMPYVKQSYLWGGVHDRMTLGELDGNSSRVLRWGWGQ